MLTTEQLSDLRAKAEAATNGPWVIVKGKDFNEDCLFISSKKRKKEHKVEVAKLEMANARKGDDDFAFEQKANAKYIAAVSPDVVLALLDELESYSDAAKFEARVAAKLAMPQKVPPSMHGKSSAWEKLRHARLAVEEGDE